MIVCYGAQKENIDLKDKLRNKDTKIAFLKSEIDRLNRMLKTKETEG